MDNGIKFDVQYIARPDTYIAYCSWGSGTPLILLHGNGEDSHYFAKCIRYFSHFFRVIAVDSRGHGRSGRGIARLNFDSMAEDLCALLDALKIPRAHLLGFSDGGNLAIKFALCYTERVEKLILNGANVSMLCGVVPWVQLPVYPAVGVLSLLAPFDQTIRNKRDVLALMARNYGVGLQDLQLIEYETLLIVGDHDMILPSHTQAMMREFPHAKLAVMQGSHFVASESPARFSLNCLNFLRGENIPDEEKISIC